MVNGELQHRTTVVQTSGDQRAWTTIIIPLCAVVIGIGGNVVWFSSQYGGQAAKIDGLDHRLASSKSTGRLRSKDSRPRSKSTLKFSRTCPG